MPEAPSPSPTPEPSVPPQTPDSVSEPGSPAKAGTEAESLSAEGSPQTNLPESLEESPWDGAPLEETWSDAGAEGDTPVEEDFGLLDPFASGVPMPPVDSGQGPAGQHSDPVLAQYRFLRGALEESHKAAGLRPDGTVRKVWKEKDAGQSFVGPTPKEQAAQASGQPVESGKEAGPGARKAGKGKAGKWKGGKSKGKWKGKKDEDANQSLIDLLGRFRHELE